MIEFRAVELENREIIERYTCEAESLNCDLSFANIFCWREHYNTAWAIVEGFLVIRFNIDGSHRVGYMQPLGRGDIAPVIEALRHDAHAHSERLRIIGLSDSGRESLAASADHNFAFDSLRRNEDYIYSRRELEELRGSRFQPKRNHINRFRTLYPDYRFEPLTSRHEEECMALESRWRTERGSTEGGHTLELEAEQRAMQSAFRHFEELGMSGIALYAGSHLAAFTYGSAVNTHTFVTHVEKADTSFEGAFAMVNRLMAESLPPRFDLINREEDMGLPGLRKAKLSYHPLRLEHKFTAIELFDDERRCKALRQEAFGDDDTFVDSFLLRHFSRRRMLTRTIDNRLAAMLHLIPFECGGRSYTYIYGVATAADFRGRKLASELIAKALKQIEAQGSTALLIPTPGTGWLRDFYGRFGFRGAVPVRFSSADDFDFGTGDTATDLAMVRTTEELPDSLDLSLVDNI